MAPTKAKTPYEQFLKERKKFLNRKPKPVLAERIAKRESNKEIERQINIQEMSE